MAETTNDPELRAAAERLTAAAFDYWQLAQRRAVPGAVIWLEDSDGRLVIITRGEYRETLMANIGRTGRAVFFDVQPEAAPVEPAKSGPWAWEVLSEDERLRWGNAGPWRFIIDGDDDEHFYSITRVDGARHDDPMSFEATESGALAASRYVAWKNREAAKT